MPIKYDNAVVMMSVDMAASWFNSFLLIVGNSYYAVLFVLRGETGC